MKKSQIFSTSLIFILLILSGCSTAAAPTAMPEASPTPEATATTAPTATSAEPEVKPTTYKDTMLPFDQLVTGNRIVILQNTINFSREGFYTEESKPVTQEIEYEGETIAAYPISYTLDFLKNGSAGTLKVINNDGSEQEISAEEFAGFFVIIDFQSDAPPVLYNPETGTVLNDFLFALTSEGEAIYSVVSGATYNAAELIANAGFDPDAAYRYMATDQFYFPVGAAENATGEVRGTLSGAVLGSFPDLKIASGKINDLVYIEVLEE